MLKIFFFVFLSLASIVKAEEPLVVKLSTEQSLAPLFLGHFSGEATGLPSNYLKQLEDVLIFDLKHSGYVQLMPHQRDRDLLIDTGSLKNFGSAQEWRSQNALYVIKGQLKGKILSVAVFLVRQNALQTFDGFSVTGNLSQDRKQIHQLSDALIRALFNEPGIASTHYLYTRKYRLPSSNQWISELWESDYDGANARKVLKEGSDYCVTPTYIPPREGFLSSMFLYVSYQNGQPKIYAANLNEGIGRRLFSLRANQLMPAISPQRDRIAFISDITGNPDLFIQDFSPEKGAVGKPRQIFTTHQATQGTPTFSPDGKRLAFVSNKDGSPRIYVMDIPAQGQQLKEVKVKLISKANRESTAPSWSPDGSKLAYCARNNGEDRQIWIYDFESDREKSLTTGRGNKENPCWAPNSLHLVFNSTGKQSGLYMMPLNAASPTKIDDGLSGEKRFPAWEPR